jgi:hypothetical protein
VKDDAIVIEPSSHYTDLLFKVQYIRIAFISNGQFTLCTGQIIADNHHVFNAMGALEKPIDNSTLTRIND